MRWSVSLFYVLFSVAIVELAASQAVPHAGFEVPVYAGPGEPLMLRVLPGQAFEDAALVFLELNGFPVEIIPELVNEITRVYTQEYAGSTASAEVESALPAPVPMFTVMVDVDEVLIPLVVYEGNNSRELAAQFVAQHGLSDLPESSQIVASVEAAVLAKFKQFLGQDAPPASIDAPARQVLVEVSIDIDDTPHKLQLLVGQTPMDAVRAFCESYRLTSPDLFEEVSPLLLAELDKALAALDVVLTVNVNGQPAVFRYNPSQDLNAALEQFLTANNLQDVYNREEIAMSLVDAVMQRLQQREAGAAAAAPGQPVATAPEPADLGSIILTVNVELTDRHILLPLSVRERHTVLEAVESFLLQNNLSRSSAPVLCRTVIAKLAEAGLSLKLFAFPIKIAGGVYVMDFSAGEDVDAVTSEFLAAVGVADHEFVDEYRVGVKTALEGFLQRSGQLVADTASEPASTAAADDAPMQAAREPEYVQSTLHIAGTEYDLEYPRNASFPDIARSFCVSEWDLLEPLLLKGLGAAVSTDECSDVVSRYMGEQWASSQFTTP